MDEEEVLHSFSYVQFEDADEVRAPERTDRNHTYSLFAYPAEDNFAGVKYPLEWVKQIQEGSFHDVRHSYPSSLTGSRMARSAGRSRLRPHQLPGPLQVQARFRHHVLLQAIWVSHWSRRAPDPQQEPGRAAQALLGRRHRADRQRAHRYRRVPCGFCVGA